MTDARDDMVDFVHGLEAVPGVITAVKVAEFLNETLVKDDRRLQKSQNMEMEAEQRAVEKELFIQKLVRNVPF
ncbi:hypothetical protein Tco_0549754, partial [Tanacetum coccineum]